MVELPALSTAVTVNVWVPAVVSTAWPFATVPVLARQQRPSGFADIYQSRPSVFGVDDPGRQTLPLQTLDELSHRRLADALCCGQCGQPGRTVPSKPGEHLIGRRSQSRPVDEVTHHKDACLIQAICNALSVITSL